MLLTDCARSLYAEESDLIRVSSVPTFVIVSEVESENRTSACVASCVFCACDFCAVPSLAALSAARVSAFIFLAWALASFAAASAAAGAYRIGNLWGGIYALAPVLAVYLAVFAGGYGFYAPLGFASVGILLLDLLMTTGVYQVLAGATVMLAMLLTLDGLRERSLRLGRLQNQMDRFYGGTAGLSQNSVMLTVLFLAGALVIAALSYLAMGALWRLALQGIAAMSGRAAALLELLRAWQQRFYDWFMSHFQYIPPEQKHHSPEQREIEWSFGNGLAALSSAVMIAALTLGGGLLAAAGAVWTYRARRPKDHPPDLEADYVDEYERLERPRWRLFRRGRDWRPDRRAYQGGMLVRYAFQTLLRARLKSDPTASAKTPNELRERDGTEEDELIDAYNRVRYGDGAVTQGELEAVRRWLKHRGK